MTVQLKRKLFTVEDYHRMMEAGVLTEDDRVELLDGEIVEMPPLSSYHVACVNRLNALFTSRLGERTIVHVQNPIRLNDLSEPEPDVALLQPQADYYAEALPEPANVLLVVEVAHSTLETDRGRKIPRYAQSGISEAWLVDLDAGCIEMYRHPQPRGYREMQTYWQGETLSPAAFPDVTLSVDEILGNPSV